jgi:hypothetical protein
VCGAKRTITGKGWRRRRKEFYDFSNSTFSFSDEWSGNTPLTSTHTNPHGHPPHRVLSEHALPHIVRGLMGGHAVLVDAGGGVLIAKSKEQGAKRKEQSNAKSSKARQSKAKQRHSA